MPHMSKKNIQNELILVAGNLARDKIIDQVKNAKCWTILADDTMDMQKREQCAICIRYLTSNEDGKFGIREDPILMLDIISEIKQMNKAEFTCEVENESLDPEIKLSLEGIGRVLLKKME